MEIKTIPLPDGLSEIQKVEFEIFQEAVSQLELEVQQMATNESIDRRAVIGLLDETRAKRLAHANDRLQQRKAIIEHQTKSEKDQIEKEFKEASDALRQRMERAYYQTHVTLQNQLKESLGAEYSAFIASNTVSIPPNPPDPQLQTRLQIPEDPVVRISQSDADRDLREMRRLL